ncbi:hypothetical protein BXZ70DRAFT_934782 [Cristinia sonorae]|uniref:RING-type domain-containing protein n=1 Tax=Cristinia sonorae TaxID=1940300 RepID=A0A8K0XQK2_9AGAR|nr:hypothetical protein BXZ70DRAFT_934782 [Cristinia sonorae]
MPSWNDWYRSPNRTWTLHQAPYVARVDSRTSRQAIAMNNTAQGGAVVLNLGDLTGTTNNRNNTADSKKKQDTLFGPNIGIVTTGPEWSENPEKSKDDLTADIVKGWIAKSKEASHSTTTLQALVNLKRPTLRLSPLEASTDDADHADSQHHHGLEFEYDCDAPKCGIKVNVVLSPSHHLAEKSSSSSSYKHTRLLVFETITEGGFGNKLNIEEGAMLELGRFEHRPASARQSSSVPRSSSDKSNDQHAEKATPDASTPAETTADITTSTSRPKSIFPGFHLRKRSGHDRNVAGPALAVVDAETHEGGDDKPKETKESEDDVGVKVIITLTALDPDGKPLKVRNEQSTYLHIVRFGRPPMVIEGAEPEEDNRPWVVKVVKREATIGLHTFHLHEIYGLSSNSNTSTHNTAPLPTSYPPTANGLNTLPTTTPVEDEPSSECLVCLSSPREVVLLPCRHLVACRECAVNMIEYGAGGQITHSDAPADTPASPAAAASPSPGTENPTAAGEEDITTTRDADATATGPGENDENGAAPSGSEANAPQPQPTNVATPTVPTATRRKRKAKGWACPVCRQPYTSLLRITTTAPSKDLLERDSTDLPASPTVTNGTNTSPVLNGATPGETASPRFGFLRGWPGRGTAPPQDAAAANV